MDSLVDVIMPAYNHERYISKAIESVVAQKTTFNYRLLIGDDCSTDSTREIIESYRSKFPNIICPIYYEKNMGATNNGDTLLSSIKAKYGALCEGDDYWVDNNKLQKQIDALERNPDWVMCAHNVDVLNNNTSEIVPSSLNIEEVQVFSIDETGFHTPAHSCSLAFRSFGRLYKDWVLTSPIADWPMQALLMIHGKLAIFPETMSVYRINSGQWSGVDRVKQLNVIIDTIDLMLKAPEFLPFFQFKKNLTTTKIIYIKELISLTKDDKYRSESGIINYYEERIEELNSIFEDDKSLSEKVKAQTLFKALLSKFLSKIK